MTIDNLDFFRVELKNGLKTLPGQEAHELMMPSIRRSMPMDLSNITNAKLSSVLLMLYTRNGQLMLPLTKRHDYKGTHGGQISLPGGKHEGQESRVDTALREAEEEVGVLRSQIEVIGTMTELYIPPSNFKVLPVIGVLENEPEFIREEYEVEQILEVTLDEVLDKTNHKVKDISARTLTLKDTPYIDIQGHVVWGATAMILSELAELVRRI